MRRVVEGIGAQEMYCEKPGARLACRTVWILLLPSLVV